LRRHVFEVSAAVDDFPKIFAGDALEGRADGEQAIGGSSCMSREMVRALFSSERVR